MPNTAAAINVKLRAGTAELVEDLSKAKVAVKSFGQSGVTETRATRAAFKALEGDITKNSRAAEQFAEKMLGLGGLAKIAFPIVGGMAFAGMLVAATSKLVDFIEKLKDAPDRAAAAFRDLVAPMQLSNAELRVANDRLDEQIAKLTGRPKNSLKAMLDEATVSALKLAEAIDADFKKLAEYLKKDEVKTGFIERVLGGATSTGGVEDRRRAAQAAMDAKNAEFNRMAEEARLKGDKEELAQVERLRIGVLQSMALAEKEWADKVGKALEQGKGPFGLRVDTTKARAAVGAYGEEMGGVATRVALTGEGEEKKGQLAVAEANKEAAEAAAKAARQAEEARKKAEEIARKKAEAEERYLEELGKLTGATKSQLAQVEEFIRKNYIPGTLAEWLSKTGALRTAAAALDAKAGIEAFAKSIEELDKQLKPGERTTGVPASPFANLFPAPAAPVWNPVTKQIQEKAQEQAETHRQTLAQLDEELNALRQFPELFKDQNGAAMTQEQIQLAIHNIEKERLDLQMKIAAAQETPMGSLRQFFLELKTQTNAAGQSLYDALKSALDKTSDNLAKLFTGKKTNWGKDLESIGQQMVQTNIKGMMTRGLGSLPGVGKLLASQKRGETPGSPLFVHVTNALAASGAGTGASAAAGGIPGSEGAGAGGPFGWLSGLFGAGRGAGAAQGVPGGGPSSGAGGLMRVLLSDVLSGGRGGVSGTLPAGMPDVATSMISQTLSDMMAAAPALAGGGDVAPDQAYLVGERGPELLVGASGRIVSNAESRRAIGGGSGASYYIDARNTDPAQTDARVRRALVAVHGSAVATSAAVANEQSRRTPAKR